MATVSATSTIQSGAQQTPCQDAQASCSPCDKENVGWRKIVRNFTPSWFAVTMGTGIVSVLLHNLPYNATWISHGLAVTFFVLNIALFTVFTVITVLRYALYPEIWKAMVIHPAQSMFLGCFPMGFATIINMMVFVLGGNWAWAFWWLDAALSIATCISVPFVMIHQHRPGLQAVTAASLLPIVPVVVASSTGGIVAEALSNPSHAFTTLIASYVLWGIGICFSGMVLALYFHRLTIHSLPPKEAIVSVFLPIGPLGQGGFGIQQLGKVSLKLFPQTTALTAAAPGAVHGGEILYFVGLFLALIMWGFALVWLSFALISLATMEKIPFNMGWWGFTFPLGVLATCTGMLAQDLDSPFFRVMTMIFSLSVCFLWLLVAVRTLHQAISGEIFFAPCLKDIRDKQAQAGSDRRV
ncbi:voltage-dependent anion channel [Colletotrichum godetiae]|uniref:Sulfite efflux pump SSU1 n=1 Tax=Colletotrichum godetiae TaxID=1209918 RepID=A0AAJ0EZE0_9PEZI|nr:voltage-dependent anion channel [Colletotrichum godetiae]KAK1699988.1 voltage-dependent anion channel [Colletotrichum godetiae]